MYTYRCVIAKIIDGDTVDVDIDLGFDIWMRNQRIRFAGIDAPETRTRDLFEKAQGLRSKEYVAQMLPVGSEQTLITTEYNSNGKYGRILGTFKMYDAAKDCWSDLSTIMLEQGYADVYGS